MSNYDNVGAFLMVTIFAMAMWLVGGIIGALWNESTEREKFIIYCTNKGDTYKTCDDIFNGREPSQP